MKKHGIMGQATQARNMCPSKVLPRGFMRTGRKKSGKGVAKWATGRAVTWSKGNRTLVTATAAHTGQGGRGARKKSETRLWSLGVSGCPVLSLISHKEVVKP